MKHDVYEADYGTSKELFSAGVTRDFGSNKVVALDGGGIIFCSVMPLKVDPVEHGMTKVGAIES